jgi:hypothetical protein
MSDTMAPAVATSRWLTDIEAYLAGCIDINSTANARDVRAMIGHNHDLPFLFHLVYKEGTALDDNLEKHKLPLSRQYPRAVQVLRAGQSSQASQDADKDVDLARRLLKTHLTGSYRLFNQPDDDLLLRVATHPLSGVSMQRAAAGATLMTRLQQGSEQDHTERVKQQLIKHRACFFSDILRLQAIPFTPDDVALDHMLLLPCLLQLQGYATLVALGAARRAEVQQWPVDWVPAVQVGSCQ